MHFGPRPYLQEMRVIIEFERGDSAWLYGFAGMSLQGANGTFPADPIPPTDKCAPAQ
jgi:hypothetical protein